MNILQMQTFASAVVRIIIRHKNGDLEVEKYSDTSRNLPSRLRWSLLVLVALVLLGSGCGNKPVTAPARDGDKLKVAVSIVPQATFVKEVGGDLVEVVTMIPPGGNPENYSPTPQQMMKFSDADIYFTVGVATEQANLLPYLAGARSNVIIIDLPSLVDQKYPPVTFPTGERDPHMWLSPKRVQEIVRITAEELTRLDPVHADTYAANASNYNQRLDRLDLDIKASLDGVSNRTFIVYHPAFGYFADDYGLTMIALEEEGKEATALELQRVIDLARSHSIKVVFYQAEVDNKQSRTLAQEIGGQAEMVAPLDPDYIGNLEKIALTFRAALQ